MIRFSLSAAIAALGILLAVSTSCKSTQPTENDKQVVSLSFGATGRNAAWNCWDSSDVLNPVYCEQILVQVNPPVAETLVGSAPWAFSAEVSVIPAGRTDEQLVVTTRGTLGAYPSFTNETAPDLLLYPGRVLPQSANPQFVYSNPRKVTQSSPVYAAFAHFVIPPPNVFGSPSTYELTVHKGDTIIVRARKIRVSDYVIGLFPPSPPDPELKLFGTLTVNGAAANAIGTTLTSIDDAAGLTFSYTVR